MKALQFVKNLDAVREKYKTWLQVPRSIFYSFHFLIYFIFFSYSWILARTSPGGYVVSPCRKWSCTARQINIPFNHNTWSMHFERQCSVWVSLCTYLRPPFGLPKEIHLIFFSSLLSRHFNLMKTKLQYHKRNDQISFLSISVSFLGPHISFGSDRRRCWLWLWLKTESRFQKNNHTSIFFVSVLFLGPRISLGSG